MAKQSKQHKKAAQVKQNPQSQQSSEQSPAKSIGKVIGCACLLVFIFFEELWVGTLAGALAFACFFVLQVFVDKSRYWYTSGYLYATIVCAALAYLEYQNGFISKLIGL